MELGALILFANRLSETVSFDQAVGIPLEEEDHEDGPEYFACELGSVHFAVFEGSAGAAPPFRVAGGVMPGLATPSLQRVLETVQALGATVIEPPTEYPWGPRMLVEDPDGRTVGIFERKS